jgi:DNA-binding NarL/FixJ family response regulator
LLSLLTARGHGSPENPMARILLADDHELIRKGLRAIIEGNKDWLVCGEAENGQEAIERTLELQPDLIILDVTMPVLNGLQAARQIRELAPATKILMLSMHDSPQLANEAVRVGADGYLTKTGARGDLLDTIAALLNSTRG